MRGKLYQHHLFWPLFVLGTLLLFNLIYSPDFFSIVVRQGNLYGSLIDILNFGAPLILVSIGMTLVIATGGIDLSVGSIVAISGAMACLSISKGTDQNSILLVLGAVGASIVLSIILGVWNGVLVTVTRIQPIIATLILMVAGRGIAQLITSGQIITVSNSNYEYIGAGTLAALPFSIFIVAAVLLIASLLTRRTALGLFIESVGKELQCKPSGRSAFQDSYPDRLYLLWIMCGNSGFDSKLECV